MFTTIRACLTAEYIYLVFEIMSSNKHKFHIPSVEDIEKGRKETDMRFLTEPLTSADKQQQKPTSQSTTTTTNTQSVLVNEVQRGNPLLEHVRNIRWSYSREIIPDYVIGRTTGLLFLSIKYHRLHPEYISSRISAMGTDFRLRVILVHVDTDDCKIPLREINRISALSEITLLLAWSLDEAGRYIECLKTNEFKQPDGIKERVEDNYMARLTNSLTSIRSVNKTDVLTLSANFGSLKGISKATVEKLALCPGVGDLKAQRIYKAFHESF